MISPLTNNRALLLFAFTAISVSASAGCIGNIYERDPASNQTGGDVEGIEGDDSFGDGTTGTSPGDGSGSSSGGSSSGGSSGSNGSDLPDQPVPGTGFISYIGCSQARNDIQGYEKSDPNWVELSGDVGRPAGTRLHNYETGGGIIYAWKSNSEYFNAYDAELVKYGDPEAIWFQICIRAQDVTSTTYADVKDVLNELRTRHGDIDIYVSGLEFFDPVDLCTKSGDAANTLSRQWADDLVADELALRGPDLGPLTAALTIFDNCHPNDDGGLLTGGQLYDFFN